MTESELIEQLSACEHSSWSRWMQYLIFNKCTPNQDGSFTIPADFAERWIRQIETPYAELSEQEKQSDRDEVAHILPIIQEYVKGKIANAAIATISRGGLGNPIGRYPMKPLQKEQEND